MLPFIDNFIERRLTRYLRARREKVINQTIQAYREKHNLDDNAVNKLTKMVNLEIDRVFAIADHSIIHARIHQARWAFWITSIIATIVALALAIYPPTSLTMFFTPLISPFVAWVVYIVTIPVNYNGRVQGAMDSALVVFEDSEQHKRHVSTNTLNELQVLRNTINEMQLQIATLQEKVNRVDAQSSTSVVRGVTLWQLPESKSYRSAQNSDENIKYEVGMRP